MLRESESGRWGGFCAVAPGYNQGLEGRKTPASAPPRWASSVEARRTRSPSHVSQEEVRVLKEFKAFIMRGNLVEIAVGLVVALAFAAVVASFVADIVTPIIAAFFGQPDFSSLKIDIGESAITYGKFLNALVSFLIVAFVMFMVIKAYNRMAGPKDAIRRPCPYCKTDIALDATRCPNCTSQLEGVAA